MTYLLSNTAQIVDKFDFFTETSSEYLVMGKLAILFLIKMKEVVTVNLFKTDGQED